MAIKGGNFPTKTDTFDPHLNIQITQIEQSHLHGHHHGKYVRTRKKSKQKTSQSTVKAPRALGSFGLSIPADVRRALRFYDGGSRVFGGLCRANVPTSTTMPRARQAFTTYTGLRRPRSSVKLRFGLKGIKRFTSMLV